MLYHIFHVWAWATNQAVSSMPSNSVLWLWIELPLRRSHCGTTNSFAFKLQPRGPTLTFLNDGLWLGILSQILPNSPELLMIRIFYHSNKRETKTEIDIQIGAVSIYSKPDYVVLRPKELFCGWNVEVWDFAYRSHNMLEKEISRSSCWRLGRHECSEKCEQ